MNWIEISTTEGRRWVNLDHAIEIETFRDSESQIAVGRIRIMAASAYQYIDLRTQDDLDRALYAIGQDVSSAPKPFEPDSAPEFKIGERFFVTRMPHGESDWLPKSFVLTDKQKTGAGNVYLTGSQNGGKGSVCFDVRQCYPTWNDVAKALGVMI